MDDIFNTLFELILGFLRMIARGFHTVFQFAEAIVSRPARERLKHRWNSEALEKVKIIAGGIFGVAAVYLTFAIALPLLS